MTMASGQANLADTQNREQNGGHRHKISLMEEQRILRRGSVKWQPTQTKTSRHGHNQNYHQKNPFGTKKTELWQSSL